MNLNPLTIVFATLALGLAIRFLLRLAYGARGPERHDPVYSLFRVISWLLLIPLACVVAVWSLFGAFVPVFVVWYSGLEMALAKRSQMRQEAWSIVTRAMAANLPVGPALQGRLDRFRGPVLRRLRRFVKDLAKGTELPVAIGKNARAFPPMAQAYAALAADGGLPISVVAGLEPVEDQGSQVWGLTRRFSYLAWVTLLMIGIVTFIFVAIVPAFEAIFVDFGLELPAISRSLIGLHQLPFAELLVSLISLTLILLGLFVVIVMLCYAVDLPVLGLLTDYLFSAWRRADVLRLLANVVENRMPLPDAINRLAQGTPRYPIRFIAHRLRQCHDEIDVGADWSMSLERADLIDPVDRDLLRAAQSAGNTPWALRSIADRRVAQAAFQWEAWQQIGFTLAIVVFGLFVAWICIALFVPLVKLINGLA
ncbi:type IV pilin biogenesis protein [Botrimarina colliarenosi]|uniref:Type IV pilin biogenesis protein n=1 Tax=Botrimarina colliarenosi TaxID=2528001 RepID=A0A5C6A4W9_9BACT|nr:type II secretion system F family protein [Botrimarina colliarenosi]TWT94101.1 type IV pilin biogenesis protein [Botrimarina colliarenosi]